MMVLHGHLAGPIHGLVKLNHLINPSLLPIPLRNRDMVGEKVAGLLELVEFHSMIQEVSWFR
jgi:hypothetical protein